VPEHGNELVAQFPTLPFAEQGRLAGGDALLRLEMQGDQIGEEPEHLNDLRPLQLGRAPVDGTQRAEEAAARIDDRHRNIALEAVHSRRRMAAEHFIVGNVVDDDRLTALPDLVADRRLDLEFAPGLEPKLNFVEHRAGDPAILRHPGDRGEAHAGRAAHDLENLRDRIDARDRGDVFSNGPCHF
jgi:hypothetical protein